MAGTVSKGGDRGSLNSGARDRNRTGTPVIHEAADFKSDVSTYFTTRAHPGIVEQKTATLGGFWWFGGNEGIRTLDGAQHPILP